MDKITPRQIILHVSYKMIKGKLRLLSVVSVRTKREREIEIVMQSNGMNVKYMYKYVMQKQAYVSELLLHFKTL